MGRMIELSRGDGKRFAAYEVDPIGQSSQQHGAGVVIIHEAFGLVQSIKDVADRFAGAGFQALAVDLFDGRTATTLAEARGITATLDQMIALGNIAAAVAHLHSTNGKVGVLGFCMGGGFALGAGVHLPGLDAVACFYGLVPFEAADPANMKAPVIGHFGLRDEHITPDLVKALEERLARSGVRYEFHHYDAGHAFFNHGRPEVYSAPHAEEAWTRTRAFFEETLRG